MKTNKKSIKRSLALSILSLIMCAAMLIGTTYAWFTDSVTSANNIITAGNLDIDLDYWNGEDWVTVQNSSEILNKNALWEPGYTETVYLRLSNVGSLAFKYQLGVNIVSETKGVNVAGEEFKLSDYIYFDVVEGVDGENGAYATREDAMKMATENTKISAGYVKAGSLKAGDAPVYLAMIVHMPTTVGNEANHNGNSVPKIELGINVFATQVEAESDSFDNMYDADAELVNFVVSSESELVEALANAKNGDVIGIKGNVTWTTGAGIGSTPFVDNANTRSVGNPLTFITIKGMDADATFTAIGKGVGAIGIDNGTVIFKDLKIADESVSYAENSWEYGYLEFRGNTVFDNCDIVNAVMMEGETATFINCTLNSNDSNQYAVWVSDGVANFENCTFSGARGLKVHEAYGSEVEAVSVNNCKFIELSKKPGVALGDLNAATSISFTNNQFIGTQAGDQGNYKYETDTDVTTFAFVDENNLVAGNVVSTGLFQDDNGVYYATTTGGLNAGISAAQDGETVVLTSDITYTGNGYANITKNITLDLNGNNINTTSYSVVAKAGTIKNGTITNPVGGRAALRTWSGVSIENVTVVSPKNGGITVASGNTLPYIKNVTIEAQTYGIELQNYASVGSIENVTIVAGKNGIVAQAATVGEIKNCTINGAECGVWAQLKGTQDLDLSFVNSSVNGGNYGLYVCDEGAAIVPDGVAKVNYDVATVFEGGVKAKEFAFGQADKLFINGGKTTLVANADALVAAFDNLKAGDVLYITADIDMSGKTVSTVRGNKGFTMLGNGYTISNLNSTAQALFVSNSGSSAYAFENVVLKNCSVVSTSNYAALFVGDGDTSDAIVINNCQVIDCTVESAKYAAAFVAYTAGYNKQNDGPVYSDVTISNCSVVGGSITGGGSVGVAVGHSGGNADTTTKVENLTIKGVAINGEDAAHTGIAIGTANVGKTIINNVTYENVTGNYNADHELYGRSVLGTTGSLTIDGVSK